MEAGVIDPSPWSDGVGYSVIKWQNVGDREVSRHIGMAAGKGYSGQVGVQLVGV